MRYDFDLLIKAAFGNRNQREGGCDGDGGGGGQRRTGGGARTDGRTDGRTDAEADGHASFSFFPFGEIPGERACAHIHRSHRLASPSAAAAAAAAAAWTVVLSVVVFVLLAIFSFSLNGQNAPQSPLGYRGVEKEGEERGDLRNESRVER